PRDRGATRTAARCADERRDDCNVDAPDSRGDGTGDPGGAARARQDCSCGSENAGDAGGSGLVVSELRGEGVKQGLFSALFIARKDLRTEFRTKEALNASVSFSLVVLMLFSFAFDLGREEFYDISGGLLWLVYVFAGALIVNRSFVREVPNDCIDILIASPMPAWALFLGKVVAGFTLLMIVELVSLPVFGLFNNIIWLPTFWPQLGVMLLASWGIAVTGVAFSAITVNVRLRELMLPVLHY